MITVTANQEVKTILMFCVRFDVAKLVSVAREPKVGVSHKNERLNRMRGMGEFKNRGEGTTVDGKKERGMEEKRKGRGRGERMKKERKREGVEEERKGKRKREWDETVQNDRRWDDGGRGEARIDRQ